MIFKYKIIIFNSLKTHTVMGFPTVEECNNFVENNFNRIVISFLCIMLVNYLGFSKVCNFVVDRVKTAIGLVVVTILMWFQFIRYMLGLVENLDVTVGSHNIKKRKEEYRDGFEKFLRDRFIVSDEELFELVKDYIDKEKENDFIYAMNEVFEKKKMRDGVGLKEVVEYFLQYL